MRILCQHCGHTHLLEAEQIGWVIALVYDRRSPAEFAIDGRWRQRCSCGEQLEVIFACHDDGSCLQPERPRFRNCQPSAADRGYVYLAPRRGYELLADAQDCCESAPAIYDAACPRVLLPAAMQKKA